MSSLVLSHWAWGRLHATEAHKFLLSAHQDGTRNSEIQSLAQLGAWGSRPGNLHRDLTNRYLKNNTLPEPQVFNVPYVTPKTLEVDNLEASAILPHDLFASIFHNHPLEFDEIFGVDDLPTFWRGASRSTGGVEAPGYGGHETVSWGCRGFSCLDVEGRSRGCGFLCPLQNGFVTFSCFCFLKFLFRAPRRDPRLAGHPVWREAGFKKWFLPLRVHGDGAEMMANDSVLVTNWTGLLAKGTTRNLSCFMAAWPYSITAKQAHHGSDTWRSIWKVLRWSFDALASGKHPSVD